MKIFLRGWAIPLAGATLVCVLVEIVWVVFTLLQKDADYQSEIARLNLVIEKHEIEFREIKRENEKLSFDIRMRDRQEEIQKELAAAANLASNIPNAAYYPTKDIVFAAMTEMVVRNIGKGDATLCLGILKDGISETTLKKGPVDPPEYLLDWVNRILETMSLAPGNNGRKTYLPMSNCVQQWNWPKLPTLLPNFSMGQIIIFHFGSTTTVGWLIPLPIHWTLRTLTLRASSRRVEIIDSFDQRIYY